MCIDRRMSRAPLSLEICHLRCVFAGALEGSAALRSGGRLGATRRSGARHLSSVLAQL
jgi:hypothetical protein